MYVLTNDLFNRRFWSLSYWLVTCCGNVKPGTQSPRLGSDWDSARQPRFVRGLLIKFLNLLFLRSIVGHVWFLG